MVLELKILLWGFFYIEDIFLFIDKFLEFKFLKNYILTV